MMVLHPGCCSAVSPCEHQDRDPTTLCPICQAVEDRHLGRETARTVIDNKEASMARTKALSNENVPARVYETRERVLIHQGSQVYLFRDYVVDGKVVLTAYGTKDSSGDVSWYRCKEGASFAEVEPLATHGWM